MRGIELCEQLVVLKLCFNQPTQLTNKLQLEVLSQKLFKDLVSAACLDQSSGACHLKAGNVVLVESSRVVSCCFHAYRPCHPTS